MTKIIAFGYQKRVGKDTCAKFLDSYLRVARPGLKVKKVSFASKLKDVSWQLYGWAGLQPGVYYETEAGAKVKEVVLPKIGKSPRQIWIEVGNKLREVWPGTWLDYVLLGGVTGDVVIITDLRFPNEGDAVIAVGGLCYMVDRPGMEKGNDAAETALDNWPKWHGVVANHGTLADLHDTVESIGREILDG